MLLKIKKMKKQDYHTNITVNATAHEAFESINSVSQWWTENLEGSSQKLNDEFTVRFGETFVTVKIVELLPDRKIVWHVIDCNKPWLKDKKEWKDTKISFEISKQDKKTEIRFTHLGLVPGIECFEACSNAWSQYIQRSLLSLITNGQGQPNNKEK
jgi:hypothetical protein